MLKTDDHFRRLAQLLELEADAEKAQLLADIQRSAANPERSGQTLTRLVITDTHAGLGGRILVSLAKRNQTESLPWSRLNVGTPVVLSEEVENSRNGSTGAGWRGVVSRRDRQSIQIAIDEWPDSDNSNFRLDLSTDEVARRRQREALARVRTARGGHGDPLGRLAQLRRILLYEQLPDFDRPPALVPLDPTLNDPQRAAVALALSARDVAIIHGPPGTGKTTTVVEVIRQAIRRGDRVLACAPSNLAVDNIFERLLAVGEPALRLGHPARVLPGLREHTLDVQVENHPDTRLARQLMRQAHTLRGQASKFRRAKPQPGERREMRQEANQLLADARRIEAQTVERILDAAHVLCATTTGLNPEMLGERRFDLCIIDEAGQSTEPGAWLPLLRSQRLILAGDHQQLSPTIISTEAAAQGFGVSLMERLMHRLGAEVSRQLTVQYRMHQAIMQFSSTEFYKETLIADTSVCNHLLADLPGVETNEWTTQPLTFIDTAGASYDEVIEPDGESRFNPQEGRLVVKKVKTLLEAGVAPHDLAVITPYAAQVRWLRDQLSPEIEIDSVDGFQGREKEVVIISLVRSNETGEIGFLADTRRMNVALTRARRKLLIIGDSATVTTHSFYRRMVDYFEQAGAYRSVWEEM